MTYGGRLLVRAAGAIGYIAFGAATFVALFVSPVPSIRYLGGFLMLALLDRLKHLGQGDIPFRELPKDGEINLASYISPKSFHVLERAYERSAIKKSNFYLETAEALLATEQIKKGLSRLDIKAEEVQQKLQSLEKEPFPAEEDRYAEAQALIILAAGQALQSGHRFIRNCDMFSSLASIKEPVTARLFHMFSLSSADIESAIVLSDMVSHGGATGKHLGSMVPEAQRNIRHRIMNRAWTSRPTPTLDHFAVDYTDIARSGQMGFMIGHEKEYNRLIEALSRGTSPNALLVGEEGVGKGTIISHLAFNIVKDQVPKELFDRRLVGLDIARMVAGAAPEEVQKRIQEIVQEIMSAENVILYLPDIHNLLKTSGGAFLSAADAFLPIIRNNSFPVIGTTFPKEFKANIESRSDFVNIFEVIEVEEISEAEAQRILTLEGVILEKQTGVAVSFGAVKMAVSLAKKYFSGTKFLPGSAEELLRSALSSAERKGEKNLGPEEIIAVAETKTNIPIHEASKDEAKELLNFEATVHEKFIDQEEAVKAVGNSLREYRSGLARKGGPIASFLFVGPTGVGKTELAKIVAGIQFGSKDLMVRFDMTEYQDKKSFERLIGSADGSVRGALTDSVIAKPYSLVLLDEFEKAFPDILDLFLQVLDDGRLTDGLGRTVDFQNTIIIATSNAHSDIINQSLREGKQMSDVAEYLKKRLTDVFKPELINRFSKVVIFRDLEPKELKSIVGLQLKELSATLAEQGMELTFDPSVADYVVKLGYDPAFGARPMRRVIEEKIRSSLAEKILGGEIEKGTLISVVAEGDALVFKNG